MTGLYKFRQKLLVDPRTVVFPNRCIFTNEPVDELSHVKVADVQAIGITPLMTTLKNERYLALPLSDARRRRKVRRWLIFAFVLKLIGVGLILGGLLVPWIAGLEIEKTIGIGMCGGAFGGVILLVGFFIPHLEDTVDTNCIYNIGFLKSGLIMIPNVSKDFLDGLPEATAGWLHGFLWIESINLPPADSRQIKTEDR